MGAKAPALACWFINPHIYLCLHGTLAWVKSLFVLPIIGLCFAGVKRAVL